MDRTPTAAQHSPTLILLKEAVELARAGNKERARQILTLICGAEPYNEKAWLWRASLADEAPRAIEYLNRVLRINPENATARQWLARLQPPPPPKPEPAHAEGEHHPSIVIRCPFCDYTAHDDFARCSNCHAIVHLNVREIASGDGANERQLRRAIQHFKGLLAVRDEFSLHYYAAVAHLNLLESTEAIEHLTLAGRLKRNDAEVSAALSALESRQLVLIADDCVTVRNMVARSLESSGYRTARAANGFEALNLVAKVQPRAILLDVSMPLMDGYQACKKLKAQPALKNVPVIMLSGNDGFIDKIKGKMAGASDYLTKPFDRATVLRAIQKHINK